MFCKDLSQTVHLWGGGVWTSNGIAQFGPSKRSRSGKGGVAPIAA